MQSHPAKDWQWANPFHSKLIPILDPNPIAQADIATAVSDLDKAAKL